ncbi:MAG TPA: DUF4260 domain-containing protein [Candidatus Methylacidiphilales bacterium]|nr:DUF4260 domain-containing protein [Candidatus Methylacidiphilales bacterium]
MNFAVVWQRMEGLVIFVVGLLLAWQWGSGMPWWGGLLIFFAPDLSFIAYIFGPKVGAYAYNTVHVYAFGAAFMAVGILMSHPLCLLAGVLWFAHCGFDRMFGYGLKLPEGFSYTHLGRIGKHTPS